MNPYNSYRRRQGRHVWHFHPQCHHYPWLEDGDLYSELDHKPSGDLCNECQSKSKKDPDNALQRGLDDLNAGRVSDFKPRSRP